MNLKDDRGLPAGLKVKALLTTKENTFRAKEIFGSEKSTTVATFGSGPTANGVATNNTNSVRDVVPGGVITTDYLSNPKAWALLTDSPNGFIRFDRMAKTNRDWDIPAQEYHVYGAHLRDAFYCADPARAIYWFNPV
jgi:hypothetical protein